MAKAEQPSFPKWDKRLLGVWKSDRRRTFRDWTWTKKLTPQKRNGSCPFLANSNFRLQEPKLFNDFAIAATSNLKDMLWLLSMKTARRLLNLEIEIKKSAALQF
jgi:hypothetical protein